MKLPLDMKLTVALAALAIGFPFLMQSLGLDYYVSFASRVLIYALAATSLNLILGYGGMVSFGHAAFVGVGAYTAAILIVEGMPNALLGWPLAMCIGALLALGIGLLSLRTSGVYFIMLTLAFAQMIYYLCVSMKSYGGEEGLNLPMRSTLPGLDLKNDLSFYFVCLTLLALCLFLMRRLIASRYGHVIQAIRENQSRMQAIGYDVQGYKLVCFVIAGAFGALAGALLVNHGKYVSPAMMHWTQSGTLMIMVIMGGVGRQYGGLLGAMILLGIEELLANYKIAWLAALYPNYQQHSMLGVGLLLLAIVLFAPQGLASLLDTRAVVVKHGAVDKREVVDQPETVTKAQA
jgi:branched-chain amino acid transport system permease protein